MKILSDNNTDRFPIKGWLDGLPLEDAALQQYKNIANLPFIHPRGVAAMADSHWGLGGPVGCVMATKNVLIPAVCGVDLGCGMSWIQTNLKASDLPDNLDELHAMLDKAIPNGRTNNGGPGDRGAWGKIPQEVWQEWGTLQEGWDKIVGKYPKLDRGNLVNHLGTLGGGNHFTELCIDENQNVSLMLHSGSRGPGNRIGTFFIEKAKEEMERFFIHLPDTNLAYLPEGSQYFNDYVFAVHWAQEFARINRELMMDAALTTLDNFMQKNGFPEDRDVGAIEDAVSCHHNYISKENHFGENVWVTRKGAVRARKNDLAVIPGSMGAKSFIVRGKENPDSYHSCSHGAGRVMSRAEAKRRYTVDDLKLATEGVTCRKDESVLDEIPHSYKDIDLVIQAQQDLIEVVHVVKQILCLKGPEDGKKKH